VAGLPGSGKTEFATFLSARTGWALLEKDAITRPLVECVLAELNGDPNDRQSATYRTTVRPMEYRCLTNAAFANIDNGVSSVLTAPFLAEVTDPGWVSRLAHRCATAGADLGVVWVSADPETMHTYLAQRDAARDAWKLSYWDQYLSSIDLATRPRCPHFHFDNSSNNAEHLTVEAGRVAELLSRE
jgi:predicted kinase